MARVDRVSTAREQWRRLASPLTFIGRVNHGNEWLAVAELELAGARVQRLEHRALWFDFPAPPRADALARLATLDDVFLLLAELPNVPRQRTGLGALAALRADLSRVAAQLQRFRPVTTRTFTIVASALGKRNYGRYEMEAALGAALAGAGWAFEDSREGSAESDRLSLRLHVADGAFLAARVFHAPLHRRAYRTDTHPGALRPPVAAALALLADPRPGERLLDPFCGSGTLAIEAARRCPELRVQASDASPERLDGARDNARRAGVRIDFRRAHAQELALAPDSLDLVVTNPPWEQKVELERTTSEADWLSALARALRPDGRAVILSAAPESVERLIHPAGYAVACSFQLSLFGSFPTALGFTRPGTPFFRPDTPVGAALRRNFERHAQAKVGPLEPSATPGRRKR